MRLSTLFETATPGPPGPARRHLLIVLAGLLPGWTTQAQSTASLLRVVGSSDPPYRMFRGSDGSGMYYDLLKLALARISTQAEFSELPSARAFKMLERGEADLMMGPLRTPEREAYLHYTQIVLPSEPKVFYTHRDAAPIRELSDLQGRVIAVQRGKRYGALFDAGNGYTRYEVNDYTKALEMLAARRVDAVVLPARQGELMMAGSTLPLTQQPFRLDGEPAYVVLSKNSPWLARAPELERAFKALQQDGSWKKTLERY
ncbi:MAG: transporter substrate-binding domain-containing protein [Burkholderiaceae bacterium]|nr:transporter substrate-binding domain-containing protein [Burkholderiaceae bacterium]